jgi:hypothetical protein
VLKRNREPSGDRAVAIPAPLSLGLNDVSAPVAALSWAAPTRFEPLTTLKPPTAYSIVLSGDTARARTVAFVLATKPGTGNPLLTFNAASRMASPPPARVNEPPAYTVVPSGETASALTVPLAALVQFGSVAPVVTSTAAR